MDDTLARHYETLMGMARGYQRLQALAVAAELMRRDHAWSLDPAMRMFCADYRWRAWGELGHSVRTGVNAAATVLGIETRTRGRRSST